MDTEYTPSVALTIVSGIFLALGALCALVVTGDIVWRRGWRSMMWVMIPVYIINATYMMPVTLFVYFRYGRPSLPASEKSPKHSEEEYTTGDHAATSPLPTNANPSTCHDSATHPPSISASQDMTQPHYGSASHMKPDTDPPIVSTPCNHHADIPGEDGLDFSANSDSSDAEKGGPGRAPRDESTAPHCHHHAAARPMYATILVGVSHCGAGCVLGDLVGEWLVHGTHAKIHGESIWVELLVDYAFALLFGIVFQYFSIAPMSSEYGPKTLWRAAKADILSLTSFEVGAFGWMVAYQVGIWDYRLNMATWTYWWMMQVGMAMGFATAAPVNWWLIRKGIKEPCA